MTLLASINVLCACYTILLFSILIENDYKGVDSLNDVHLNRTNKASHTPNESLNFTTHLSDVCSQNLQKA